MIGTYVQATEQYRNKEREKRGAEERGCSNTKIQQTHLKLLHSDPQLDIHEPIDVN